MLSFTCAKCHKVYEEPFDRDSLLEKFKKDYPKDDPDKAIVLCRKCYKIAKRHFDVMRQRENWLRYAMNE